MTTSRYDVIVIGAGLAGTSATTALARAGYAVALVDTHAVYPSEFRAEKLGGPQMALFDTLGLGAAARASTTRVDEVWVARCRTLVSRLRHAEYSVRYTDLINRLRAALPAAATFVVGRVAEVETGPERQEVTLSDGRHLSARLVVVATGLGDALRRKVGIGKRLISARHSLSFGFNLASPPSAFAFPGLTFYADRLSARAAYLTLFPIGSTMRANLFVYRDPAEDWTKAFRAAPEASLRALLPGLDRICPDLTVADPVEMRPVDLVAADGYRRDGVVLIGDAFLTPCPVPGTGIGRVLTDVDRLCNHHVPAWFASPGMEAGKVGSFYDDPVKTALDAQSLQASLYARSLATDPGLAFAARRLRNRVAHHALHGLAALRGAAAGTGAVPLPQAETAPGA